MTNYDKELQSLTIGKYAWFIFNSKGCNCKNCPVFEQCKGFICGYDCIQKIIKWLESEAEDNG